MYGNLCVAGSFNQYQNMSTLGRPRKILDEVEIAKLVGKGFTVEFVADVMGVNQDTLYRNYSEALRKGYAFRNGCLQAKQFKSAMVDNNPTMQIWLGKQWLHQTDKRELSTTIEHVHPDLSTLSDEQLEHVRAIVDGAGVQE